jgi:hypothetical protein
LQWIDRENDFCYKKAGEDDKTNIEQMKKSFLLAAAVALFLFYNYGLFQWIQSGHGFKDVWRAATSDWLLAITLLDMGIFSLLCLIWLYRDMQGRRFAAGKIFLILFVTLITGVVVPLFYLAFRKAPGPLPPKEGMADAQKASLHNLH